MTINYLKIKENPFFFGGEELAVGRDIYYVKYFNYPNKVQPMLLARKLIMEHRKLDLKKRGLKDKLKINTKLLW